MSPQNCHTLQSVMTFVKITKYSEFCDSYTKYSDYYEVFIDCHVDKLIVF